MPTVDYRKQYDEVVSNLIRRRTRSEIEITKLIQSLYKLPEDLFDKMKPAIIELPENVSSKIFKCEEVTLKDFVPTLYDLETRDRKRHAEEIFIVNRFIKAWEAMRQENDEEVGRCLLELKDRNL